MNENQPGIVIRLVDRNNTTPAELAQVAALHQQAFPRGVLNSLGPSFVQDYYRKIVASDSGHLWVMMTEDRVAGFLAATMDRFSFERRHRAGNSKGQIIRGLLTGRVSFWAVLRSMRKRRLVRDVPDRAELLAISISKDYRRGGLGGKLLAEWHQRLRETGISSYIVFTDNLEGLHFYRRAGGETLFEFRLAGEVSAAFRIWVPPHTTEAESIPAKH